MSIQFKTKKIIARFLDPTNGFAEKKQELEYRTDPLTGDLGLVRDLRFAIPYRPDFNPLMEKSRNNCPFCSGKVEDRAPKFIPEFRKEGRIKIGDSIVSRFHFWMNTD